MATKADFTEQEWDTLQRGVTGAGMLVSLSDRDFTDSFGEAKALAKYLGEQRSQSQSTLIRDLAAVHGSGFGFRTSPQELESGTLDALRTSMATLAQKAPDESDAYRQLVLGVADHVAEAKGGVAETETAAIEKIRSALEQ
jgi:tellurite resistance protein